MSCHDGTIAPDQHYGNGTVASPATGIFLTGDILGGTRPAGVGFTDANGNGGLANDHPVGFNYNAVAAGDPTGLNPTKDSNKSGTDLWIATSDAVYKNNLLGLTVQERLYTYKGASYMTCATCHDVHNRKNAYKAGIANDGTNYLTLSPQANSDLCTTCHIK
jgi:hypothetical protein